MKIALCRSSSQKNAIYQLVKKVPPEGIFIDEKPTRVKRVLTELDEVV